MMCGDKVNMTSFGYAQMYLEHSEHIDHLAVETFKGVMPFASLNQMNYMNTSRRDDLISLVYLMVFLLNKDHFLDMVSLED